MIKWIKNLYAGLLFWWRKTKLERELDREFIVYHGVNPYGIYQDDTQRKYAEGLAVVKSKVRNLTAGDNDYDRVLKEVQDLVQLAVEETPSQKAIRKALTSLARLPEKPQKQMIQERIQHFEELRKYNEERALLKQIRQAKKNGETELASQLEEKWRQDYGKVRNPR